MAWTANAGESVIWSGADALRLYRSWAGYDGSQASDIGADELSILLHWQENGLDEQGGHTIAAWLAVDGTSVLDVKRGIYLCEGLYFVCELASDWQYGTHDGATWSKATGNPRLGHAMALLGYDAKGVYLNSGGCRILMLWDAFVQAAARPNGGGVYAALSTDVINRASRRAPNGLDFEAMRADFDALRSA
jgi:hypothetical protein